MGGGGAWGSITGTLTDQTDLATALAGKSDTGHSHAQSDVTGLTAALDAKADDTAVTTALAGKSDVGHTHTASNVTDFNAAADARVAAGITEKLDIIGGSAAITYLAAPLPGSPRSGNVTAGTVSTTVSDDDHSAFPGLALCGDGSLLAVWRQGPSHTPSVGDGVIRASRSVDFGVTWGASYVVASDSLDVRDPTLTVLSDGRIAMTVFKHDGTTADGVFVAFSTDQGETFGALSAVPFTFTDWTACSGPIVELANGNLVVAGYGQNTGATFQSARVMVSTDGGMSWSGEVTIGNGPTASRHYQEPYLGLTPAGGLLAMLRSDTGTLTIYKVVSTDGGATWTVPASVIAATGRPAWLTLRSGGMVLFMRRTSDLAHAFITSWDNGATWTAASQLGATPPGGGQSTYVQPVELAAGLVAVVRSTESGSTASTVSFSYLGDGKGVTPLGDVVPVEAPASSSGWTQISITPSEFMAVTGSPSLAGLTGVGYPPVWLFDPLSTEGIMGQAPLLPSDWTTFDIVLAWAPTTTNTGTTRWQVIPSNLIVGQLPSSGAAATNVTTAAASGTIGILQETTALAGVSRPTNPLVIRVFRVGADGADTNTGDIGLVAVIFRKAS